MTELERLRAKNRELLEHVKFWRTACQELDARVAWLRTPKEAPSDEANRRAVD